MFSTLKDAGGRFWKSSEQILVFKQACSGGTRSLGWAMHTTVHLYYFYNQEGGQLSIEKYQYTVCNFS
jgi:hypothetical protein